MANRVNTILLALLGVGFLILTFYVFRQSRQTPEPGPPGPPGPAGEPAAPVLPPVTVEDNTPDAVVVQDSPTIVVQDPPSDNGAVDLDEANYGPVLATKPFPAGFIPGPTASPCIVARYLLDLPGMPSYNPQERLPWTYEERLVLQTIEQLCADGSRVRPIQQNEGFGFLAYVIFREDVPYDYDYALVYQPKLGWQLIKCLDFHGKACESVVGPYGPKKYLPYYEKPYYEKPYYGKPYYGKPYHGKPHHGKPNHGKPHHYVQPHGPVQQGVAQNQPALKGNGPHLVPPFPTGFNLGGFWGAKKRNQSVTSRKARG